MPQIRNGIFVALAVSATLGAAQLASGHDLIGRRQVAAVPEEGVNRAAIYERIRGSSKGHGGMIAKNQYVAIWWRLRQEKGASQ